ncbi:hypothetical protein FB451DRAFT_1107041 [Mycena latifolia]|nr:hypothetical protein FB451DRAFT_1569840 [Mycena latifolia]KAJ7439674.1 hypothetical protein FB451DRAFT_1107041 [Mycena latifolia]
MLWIPEERKTRSGTVFASFLPRATLLKSSTFDIAPLMREAVVAESDEQEDTEPSAHDDVDESIPGASMDDLNGLDTPAPEASMADLDGLDEPAANDGWLDELDEPLPPRKRARMADVIASGSKPLPHAHRKRAAKRKEKIAQTGQRPRPATLREHIRGERAIATDLDASKLDAAHGAYSAKSGDTYGGQKRRSVAELLGLGFQLIRWDGFESKPIVDVHGRIIAVLAGQPRGADYAEAVARAFRAIEDERQAANFARDMKHHRRGTSFVGLNVGINYGKGTRVPSRLAGKEHAPLLARLLANRDVGRLATFASAAFAIWAPLLYAYYRKYDAALHERMPHLQRNFEKSIFSCATFNFGPDVWTFKHRDVMNLAFGWCAVQALGRFDPLQGGHLILWELKLVIEFPPGALILLPSATMTHSNVPVQKGDERASFTQYTAGGIFRFIDNGFRTEQQLEEEDPEEYARMLAAKDDRWAMGLGLLSTIDDLLAPLSPVDNASNPL